MDSALSSSDHVILDACVLINLYASGKMAEILSSIQKSMAVAAYVQEVEALRIYAGPENNIRQTTENINLQPFIESGLIEKVDLSSEDEENTFITFAASLGDDGEAITGAIAANRQWIIATDDRKATSFFVKLNPPLNIVSTLQLVKQWAETTVPSGSEIEFTLRNIRLRANYEPDHKHALYQWWKNSTTFKP